jgi:hypothetical protein
MCFLFWEVVATLFVKNPINKLSLFVYRLDEIGHIWYYFGDTFTVRNMSCPNLKGLSADF